MSSITSSISQRIRRFVRKSAETVSGILTIVFKWNVKETLIAWKDYFRETGQWYLGSAAVHALALIILGLISMASSSTVVGTGEAAPSFSATESSEVSPPPAFTRFEVGDPQVEPTELDPESLSMFEAKPIASQTALYYDDSPEFVEAGGGSLTDMKGPQLGGLNGFSVKDLPGPAGKGGVGVGSGLGDKPGVGGQGEGLGFRGKGHREALLGTQGGTKATDRAVGAALNWLYRHQTSLGKWSLDFRHQCKNGTCSGPGVIRSDEAATSMALLPFLAYGLTHKSKSIYQQTISKGLTWLIKEQTADGDLASNSEQPMYAQGLATLALCEAYGMTHDEHIGSAARKAVAFVIRAQNSSTGGWRYYPGQPGDTSVTGWQVMALKSAQLAGIAVDSFVFDNAKKWFHSVAKGEHMGLYSYQPYDQVTPTRTAIGMLCTQYFGIDPKDPAMLEGKAYLLENLPDEQVMRNSYYWYYATLTMHNFGGPEWDAWNRKMRRVLILSQEKQGCATGSWDPLEPSFDIWGEKGGRLMTTAFNCLTLEVYYRYLPIFQTNSLLPNPPKAKDIDQDKDDDKVDKDNDKVDKEKDKDEVL
ncbi:MAG: prenyltransferase/squalene oxidase repeat-containing protein [Thermoguttaceae bacterium]